ncbi:PREDICTED: uncharacterized protein LOC108356494 [Rhagoletis zephyria]|uniref:uncharacterized protein LOC108356494 n=1 Tax=Rhagoletis zephyria TaxID=28612 RepID=UPI0008117E37|nr:PREDICTED: uncharacterized protein LOC108356494 [Rhagoletis zephyria]XP_017463097.1 PREDICTED: uncharacterized protein LOC108356494 [Rhagoletis zephyria]XP_036345655.1 uncharacterized protein LOC118754890 [Rhagoletis pomonella]
MSGGGPMAKCVDNPLFNKVRGLVGPAIDGCYTIYDGDSSLIKAQEGIIPIEADLNFEDELPIQEPKQKEEKEEYFTSDRANLKKNPHPLLARKRKLQTTAKETVASKFKLLAEEKMALVSAQKELIDIELKDKEEILEHNRLLRKMEIEEAKKRYEYDEQERREHNRILRQMEIEDKKKKLEHNEAIRSLELEKYRQTL